MASPSVPTGTNQVRRSTPGTGQELNGVPVDLLAQEIATIAVDTDLAQCRFTATNTWIEGTASRSTMFEWRRGGADRLHARTFSATADDPTLGHGHGPTPHEYLLHALASSLVATLANAAAARTVRLHTIETVVHGEIDIRGSLGDESVSRSGFTSIDVQVDVRGEADDELLDSLVRSACRRSPVLDALTKPSLVRVNRVR